LAKVRFGHVSLPTEWLIGDRTEAADDTELWEDLCEYLARARGQGTLSVTKTQVIMGESYDYRSDATG
jgi:hypothetical protein